jgi:hypothetical protein
MSRDLFELEPWAALARYGPSRSEAFSGARRFGIWGTGGARALRRVPGS